MLHSTANMHSHSSLSVGLSARLSLRPSTRLPVQSTDVHCNIPLLPPSPSPLFSLSPPPPLSHPSDPPSLTHPSPLKRYPPSSFPLRSIASGSLRVRLSVTWRLGHGGVVLVLVLVLVSVLVLDLDLDLVLLLSIKHLASDNGQHPTPLRSIWAL